MSASSSQHGHPAEAATDDRAETFWRAKRDDANQQLQIDLGTPRSLRCFIIDFEREAKHYGYVISASLNGHDWKEVVVQRPSQEPEWGEPRTAVHELEETGRYVQLAFHDRPPNGSASVREFRVYSEPAEVEYFNTTYDYRLRWNDVLYEPGELTAVAYKDGREIGTSTMRTAGDAAAIRLTPDRRKLIANGDDLCYVLVEAIDENGAVCPLARDLVSFKIKGPAKIAGVGNGDPLSLEPFQADHIRLFRGKAMLLLQTDDGPAGTILVTAIGPRLMAGEASVRSNTESN